MTDKEVTVAAEVIIDLLWLVSPRARRRGQDELCGLLMPHFHRRPNPNNRVSKANPDAGAIPRCRAPSSSQRRRPRPNSRAPRYNLAPESAAERIPAAAAARR